LTDLGAHCDPAEVKEPYTEEVIVDTGVEWKFNLPEPLHRICTAAIRNYAVIAPCLKNPKFRSEEEWRIIHTEVKSTSLANRELRFRTVGALIVPYLELPLYLEGDTVNNPSPEKANFQLRSIRVGPSLHPTLARRSLELRLGQSGIASQIRILSSEIPVKI